MLSTSSDVTLPHCSCSSPPKRNCIHTSTHVAISKHKSKCKQTFSCMAITKCTHTRTHWHIIAPTTVATNGIISAHHTRSISHTYITSHTVTTSQHHHITPPNHTITYHVQHHTSHTCTSTLKHHHMVHTTR
jgi:hypothetical protein